MAAQEQRICSMQRIFARVAAKQIGDIRRHYYFNTVLHKRLRGIMARPKIPIKISDSLVSFMTYQLPVFNGSMTLLVHIWIVFVFNQTRQNSVGVSLSNNFFAEFSHHAMACTHQSVVKLVILKKGKKKGKKQFNFSFQRPTDASVRLSQALTFNVNNGTLLHG